MSSGDCWWAMVQRAPGRAPGSREAALAIASLHNKPCFDLRGRRSRVSRRLQAALGSPSARRGVVWVYPVVALPGEVLPACGKGPRVPVT